MRSVAARLLSVICVTVLLALAAAPTRAVAASPYAIHPGDQLAITVMGDSTFSETTTVLDDGSVVFPTIGRLVLAGMTIDRAQRYIEDKLRPYVRVPQVTIDVKQVGQESVLVLGNVKTSGRYVLPAGARLSDAIAAAGGVGPVNGEFPTARIAHENGPTTEVSLQAVLRQGDASKDIVLSSGDVVYVPAPVAIDVTVLGAVDHPGPVEVDYGSLISMAVAKAGASSAAHSDLNHIFLTRDENGQRKTYEIDLYRALQSGDSSYDVQVAKGDVIYVPQAKATGGTIWGVLYLLRRVVLGF